MKMKIFVSLIPLALSFFLHFTYAQDLDINIDPRQAFILDKTKGALEVKICNCYSAMLAAPDNKPRPQISFPDNLTIESVTNADGSPLVGFTVHDLKNDPGNHTVRPIATAAIANASCASFLVHVGGKGVGAGAITATLGFVGPQTAGNFSANDNAVAAIPVQVNFPVKLKEFRARKEQQTAILEWISSEELNTNRFDVQRSANGKLWTTIASVPAMGESKTQIAYEAADTDPLSGENLYRLHMIDNDGTSAYSSIRSLTFEFQDVLVYPNPAKDVLHIKSNDWSKIHRITIRNDKGEQLYHSTTSSGGLIDLTPFYAGLYIVEVTKFSGDTATFRIVVAK